MNSRPIQLIAFIALFAMSAIGVIALTDYSSRPGESGMAPEHLDDLKLSDVSLPGGLVTDGTATLFVFYHPKCPCTTATARVLERLHARFKIAPKIIAVAYCPAEQEESWIESRTTNVLRNISQTQPVVDRSGKLSHRFGAKVSGHILLYDAKGQLTFSGGITPYRGHEGDSPSSMDLLERVNSLQPGTGFWPVFGCTISTTDELSDE